MNNFLSLSKNKICILDKLIRDGDIILGRGNIISKIDIRENLGNNPIYSSSSKDNGKMGEYGKYMFDEEMITWSIDGGGSFFYREKHKFSVTNVSGFIKVNTKKFDYKFLYEVLNYQHKFLKFDYQMKAHPSVIRDLYEVPMLSIKQQKRISSIFNSIDELIEIYRKKIKKHKYLKKATLNDLMTKGIDHLEFKESIIGKIPKTWEIKKLKDISEAPITKGSTPSTYGYKWTEEGILFLRSECVKINGFSLNGSMRISKEANKFLNRSQILGGDILVAITGYIGAVCIYPDNSEHANMNQHIARIRISDKYIRNFITYFLSTDIQRKKFIKIQTGQAYPQLSLKQIQDTYVCIPPKLEREKISKILNNLDEGIRILIDKRINLENLKKSIVKDIFNNNTKLKIN